jgi:prepilin-type N-terminal cleavage/methylation domain-containing protein
MMKRRPFRSQGGYSLVELLVVVAIIGMLSLVTVPPMLGYMRQVKVRSATRQLNTDLRFARQRAITQNNPVAFSFLPGDADPDPGFEKGKYILYDRGQAIPNTNPQRYNWRQYGPIRYLDGVYFLPTDFGLTDAANDTLADVIFRQNGTVDNMPAPPLVNAIVAIRTTKRLVNNHITDRFWISGSFTTTLATD